MISVRPARAADQPALLEVFVEAWRCGYAGVVPDDILASLDIRVAAEWVGDLVQSADLVTAVVADEQDRPVGFVRYGTERGNDDGAGYVAALYVRPRAARRGIGRLLLAHALNAFAADGRASATLWVFAENSQARRLYERAGFVITGESYVDPRWRTRQVRMRRSIVRGGERDPAAGEHGVDLPL